MARDLDIRDHLWAIFLLFLSVLTAGCSVQEAPVAEASGEIEIPAEVARARDAALDFLRQGNYDVVPNPRVPWQVRTGSDDLPDGFGFYFFTTDTAAMTISYPLPAADDTLYHVSFGDPVCGFCWQALIDSHGEIVATENAAERALEEQNPAAIYCQEQGYSYELLPEGPSSQSGKCVFPDGSTCKGWGYLRGQCQPGDFPAEPD